MCGTKEYMAPEMLLGNGYNSVCGEDSRCHCSLCIDDVLVLAGG